MQANINPIVLLVEDDANLGFVIQDNLEDQGYQVDWKTDGEQAWSTFQEQKMEFDLCILDVMLPNKDGFTLAQEIREKDDEVPIIFLTAKSMKEDKVRGFHLGADDYITKPFSIEELVLRMEAILRRSRKNLRSTPPNEVFELGKYRFDYKNLTLTLEEEVRTLTIKEAQLLNLFTKEANQILKRDDILNHIWGTDDYFTGRSLDVFISRLRKYLKSDDTVQLLNVHGVGFKLKLP